MEFIPAYASYGENYGEEINPDFLDRTLLMLTEHFGYDYEELEAKYRSFRDTCAQKRILEVDAFTFFLIKAIEGNLAIKAERYDGANQYDDENLEDAVEFSLDGANGDFEGSASTLDADAIFARLMKGRG